MNTKQYRFDGSARYNRGSVDAGDNGGLEKEKGLAILEQNKLRMEQLQKQLYAEGRQGLLVVIQALDAAGKDGTIGKVFAGVNPEGIQVTSFKQPSTHELAHDYLWRIHRNVPERGCIGVFNRSHYEEVLVARVNNLPAEQKLPPASLKGIWQKRYRQLREFEQYLGENGIRVVKFFLHVSKEEQARRFVERLDNPEKNWKFEAGDLATREQWEEFQKAYREAINQTATAAAPWYVVPADHKWYTHAVVSQVVADTLAAMKPQVPVAGREQQAQLKSYRAALCGEDAEPKAEEPGTEEEKVQEQGAQEGKKKKPSGKKTAGKGKKKK